MPSTTKLLAAALIAAVLSASCVFGGDDDDAEATETATPESANGDTSGDADATTPAGGDNDANGDATPGADGENGDESGTYTVQPGDRLSDIADQFGVTVDDLVEANNIEDPNLIYPGQELIIPSGGADE